MDREWFAGMTLFMYYYCPERWMARSSHPGRSLLLLLTLKDGRQDRPVQSGAFLFISDISPAYQRREEGLIHACMHKREIPRLFYHSLFAFIVLSDAD